MRFKSRDLMIDVLPAAKRFVPGLALCGQATAGGREGGDGDDDVLECGQATAGGSDGYSPAKVGLALLRRQLHETQAAQR